MPCQYVLFSVPTTSMRSGAPSLDKHLIRPSVLDRMSTTVNGPSMTAVLDRRGSRLACRANRVFTMSCTALTMYRLRGLAAVEASFAIFCNELQFVEVEGIVSLAR